MALIRLNYAVELRYGVLLDIGRKVWDGMVVDVSMGHVNVIWQADANAMALGAFDHLATPPNILNIAGPEVLRVRELAEEFGRIFGKRPVIGGSEAPDALLSNAAKSHALFGMPRVTAGEVVAGVADWIRRDGATLDKPTHFESRSGRF
jgi:uncharacterized protein YbjT (DUF2867 family)